MKRIVFAVFIVMTPLFAAAAEPVDGGDRPLLMEGKHTLYQRVLSTPGARLAAEPGGQGHTAVVPFTSFYVYARREHGGTQWVQVGTDRHGTRTGWLPAASTLEWNHGLTAAFRNPADHDRVLLFKDSASLRQLAQEDDLTAYERLYTEAQQEMLPPDAPVVAIQPPGFIDIQDDFYLIPIRQHEDIYLGNERARMLQVSSVPLPRNEDSGRETTVPRQAYSAGLAFVIDSTLSMDPYIERTREAVRKIYDTLGNASLLGDVSFGLVAFRDNPNSAAPGLGYLTRTYVDLQQGRDAASFLSRVDSLSASRVSSRDFVEDAYAGIKQAIETLDWSDYAARYIVLITDAGAREGDDPLSSTGMGAESLRKLAQDKGIAIFVLHLLTPATMANHAADAAQYRELAEFPGIGSLYYGVPTGDVGKFGEALDTLAGQITEQVRLAATADKHPAAAAAVVPPSADAQLADLQAKVAKLGYALRMKYLRKTEGDRVPEVFDAWLLDRDFRNPQRAAVDVRVLLTRDQLSDLHDVLAAVLERAEEGMLSPQTFLDELQSLAATMTRDPSQLGAASAGQGSSLADLGFMREYIEDLPYTPEVMGLSLDDWQSWSTKQQVAFVTRLEDKLDYYRALHDHTDLWVSLDNGPVSGDSVYPVPLEVLP